MGNQVRSTPGKSEVGKVGNVRETDAQNLPHHHLPSRREVGGGEQGRALASEVRIDDLLSGLGQAGRGQPEGQDVRLHALQSSRAGLIIGIDPGLGGALALLTLDGALVDIDDMPVLADGAAGRRAINAPLLAARVKAWGAGQAYCELVGPRPGEGAVGAFGFGRSRGIIEGTLGALGVPVVMLAPVWWKRRVDIGPGADRKDEARSKAIARWPGMAERFARKKDDGRAEAALIGVAGLSREVRR